MSLILTSRLFSTTATRSNSQISCHGPGANPFSWDSESVDEIVLLINRIYAPVMGGEVKLKAAITKALGISDKKADLVVSPWADILKAFREHKLNLDNGIAEKTFEASYGRYVDIDLVHLQARKAAQTGKTSRLAAIGYRTSCSARGYG